MSNNKIAIAIIHGVGVKSPKKSMNKMKEKLEKKVGNNAELVIKIVDWSNILKAKEETLWEKVTSSINQDKKKLKLRWNLLRQFFVYFLGDAFAYQPVPKADSDKGKWNTIYEDIHNKLKNELLCLFKEAPNAPLCIIAHSLGSIITSNYVWDIQKNNSSDNKLDIHGLQFKRFYTLGSPIAVWSLRYENPEFGVPIEVEKWINFFDQDDIIGYPISNLNKEYISKKIIDKHVNVGWLILRWNPGCHVRYWTDRDVIREISDDLIKMSIKNEASF